MPRPHSEIDPITGLDWDDLNPPEFARYCYKKGGGGAPPAPDPAAVARAQTTANKEAVRESAKVNQINQVSPYGNITFSGDIGEPNRTQTLELPETVQGAIDSQNQTALDLSQFAEGYVPRVAEGLADPFNTADLGAVPDASPEERQRIEQNLYDRMEPLHTRDLERLETRLANQGIDYGSRAFSSAMDDFNRGRTDARLAASNAAGNEYQRDFGMQNQNYQQRLSNALLNRTQPLNEVSALIQGAPALNQPTMPQPSQYQVAPPDILGATALQQQGLTNRFNNQQANNRGLMGGLFSLGSAAIGLSDRRVKQNVKRVGQMDDGTPIYTYRYIWGGPMQMGVMAQDIEHTKPEAVHDMNGVLAVNYGAL